MPRIFKKSAEHEDEPRLIDRLNIALDKPVELAVWAVKKAGIHCRVIPTQEPVTFKRVHDEIEGEVISVMPSKVWQFKRTVYVTGEVINQRLEASALGLVPLKLEERGMFEQDELDQLVDADDPFQKYYQPILAFGPRSECEMEQVIPFDDPDDVDMDPITMASEAHKNGDYQSAYQMIEEVLTEDLRCIDAHAHLGNWDFNAFNEPHPRIESRARRHYEAGLRIAELSFDTSFNDLLPWGYIDNRPYLRCLHGFGLCLWRAGDAQAAHRVFERMLWLNPLDNQGARFLLADIDAGKDWYQLQAEDRS